MKTRMGIRFLIAGLCLTAAGASLIYGTDDTGGDVVGLLVGLTGCALLGLWIGSVFPLGGSEAPVPPASEPESEDDR